MCCYISINASAESTLDNISVHITAFDFPPVSHIGVNGRISGKGLETVRALCIEAKLDCIFEIRPTARAYYSIENGTTDILMTANLPQFKNCCLFADWDYDFSFGILSYETMNDIPENSTSLLGKNMIIIRQWQTPYLVFPDLDKLVSENKVLVSQSNSIYSAIKMHQRKRAPFLWGSDKFDWYYSKMGIPMEDLNYKELTSSTSGLWVSKQHPRHKEIKLRLDKANKALRSSGSIGTNDFLVPELMDKVYEDAPLPF